MRQLLFLVLGILLNACGSGNPGNGGESFTDKLEWSILQNLESQNREAIDLKFSILEIDGYAVVQIPNDSNKGSNKGSDKGGNKGALYIMLNPKAPPFYKQLPIKQYNLNKEQYKLIQEHHKTISTVERALESHVAE